jgi:predicted negative regulator of RcsB-dependent stress response
MTQDKNPETVAPSNKVVQLPVNLPLELIPLYDWWKKSGPQFLIQTGIAVILVVAVLGGKQYYDTKVATANKELLKASTTEELESLVNDYGKWKVGNAARLRLAKSYYDAGKYELALSTYDDCLKKGAPVGFEEVAVMGRAVCLEAIGEKRLDEALTVYSDFIAKNPNHFLTTQAWLGKARVLALQGKKDAAAKLLETFKAEKNNDPMAEMAVTQLQGVIARYEPRQSFPMTDMSTAPVTLPATVSEQLKAK